MYTAFAASAYKITFLPTLTRKAVQGKIKNLTNTSLLAMMLTAKRAYDQESFLLRKSSLDKSSVTNYQDCIDHLKLKTPTEKVQETLLIYLLLDGFTNKTSLKFHVAFILLYVGATSFNTKQAKKTQKTPKCSSYAISDEAAQERVNLLKKELILFLQEKKKANVEMTDQGGSSSSNVLQDKAKNEASLMTERVDSLTHDRFEQILDWAGADYKQQDHKQTRGSFRFSSLSQWGASFYRDYYEAFKLRAKYTPQARLLKFLGNSGGKSNLKSLKFRVVAALVHGSEDRRDVAWLIKCRQSDNKSAGALVLTCVEALKVHARLTLLDNDSKQHIKRR